MTTYTILHNPRCSKSRAALELLQNHEVALKVIHYLKTPLSAPQLKELIAKIGINVRDCIRTQEAPYREYNLDDETLSDDDLIQALHTHPILLQRPVIFTKTHAVIGRPTENVLTLLQTPS